jgi:hypothetical protein
MEDIWSNLKQDEKYEIIRDYVRRGFNNLDAIMDDYNKNADGVGTVNINSKPARSAIEEVLNEWYGRTEWPGAEDSDIDSW